MPDRHWKAFERVCASVIKGKRYPASSGGPVDITSDCFSGSCKNVKQMSLAEIEREVLAIERAGREKEKMGVLFLKRRAGTGKPTPTLICMTGDVFAELSRGTNGDT